MLFRGGKRINFVILVLTHVFLCLDAKPLIDPGIYVLQGVSTCRNGLGYCLLADKCSVDKDFTEDDTGGHCKGLARSFSTELPFVCCRDINATSEEDSYFTTLSSVTLDEAQFQILDENPIPIKEYDFEDNTIPEGVDPSNLVDIEIVTDLTGVVGIITRPYTGTVPTRATPFPPTLTQSTTPLHSDTQKGQPFSSTESTTSTLAYNEIPIDISLFSFSFNNAKGGPNKGPRLNQRKNIFDSTFGKVENKLSLHDTFKIGDDKNAGDIGKTDNKIIQAQEGQHSTFIENIEQRIEVSSPKKDELNEENKSEEVILKIKIENNHSHAVSDVTFIPRLNTSKEDEMDSSSITIISSSSTSTPSTLEEEATTMFDLDISSSMKTTSVIISDSQLNIGLEPHHSKETTDEENDIPQGSERIKSTKLRSSIILPDETSKVMKEDSTVLQDKEASTPDTEESTPHSNGNHKEHDNKMFEEKAQLVSTATPTINYTDELAIENEIEPRVTTYSPMDDYEINTSNSVSKLEGERTTERLFPTVSTGIDGEPTTPMLLISTENTTNELITESSTVISSWVPNSFETDLNHTMPFPINIDRCGIKNTVLKHQFRSNVALPFTTTSVYEYCWSAAIMLKSQYGKAFLCNGALIERDLVITTASCLKSLEVRSLHKYRVILGDSNLKDDAHYTLQYHDILEVATHPDYLMSRGAYANDIGIIRLRTLATLYDNVCLICVPQEGSDVPSDECVATGYKTEFNQREKRRSVLRALRSKTVGGSSDGYLLSSPVSLQKPQDCKSALIRMSPSPLFIERPDAFICDQNSDPLVACMSTLDRGSPLTCEFKGRWYLVGLTSWSRDCVTEPNVYTKISFHSGWLLTARIRFYGFITHMFDL